MSKNIPRKVRGKHSLNIFINHELKERLRILADRHERTLADIVRAVIQIGIPVMEGISEAEEYMVKEYLQLFRKFRKMRNLKEI